MARTDYNLTIIGGGSGGLTAAQIAESLGARVLLIDKQELGGDCLRFGCVPSKSLLHIARVVQQSRQAANLGLSSTPVETDMARISASVQGIIARIEAAEQSYVKNVTVKFGKAVFHSPTHLTLNDEEIKCQRFLIATGSQPAIPEIAGLQETGYWTNEDVFDLLHLPASLIVAGGGPIGVELSQAFARLGTQVTLVQGPERILPREDPEVSETIAEVLRSEGIQIVTGARLTSVARHEKQKVITVAKQGQEHQFVADELLLALGRRPRLEGLDLEKAGVVFTEKGITVDEYLQSSTPSILAIGDVIGTYLFTHVASYQAGIAARNALLPIGKKKVDYRVVPWCTFTDPEAARIGLTPEEAEKQYKQVRVVSLPWHEIDRAQTEQETTGFIKLVLAGKKDEIVGVHMVGAGAGELLGEMALAMQKRLSINDIFNTIHTYPTLHTGLQQVAYAAYLSGKEAASNRKIVSTLLKLRK